MHPETPKEGSSLEDLYRSRNLDIKQVQARLNQAAADAGLPLGERKSTFNSRLAQELGKWAESQDRGDLFHNAVFRAYFVDGHNIAMSPLLVKLAESVGLSGSEAKDVLETRAFKSQVDADWSNCYALGITAVPTFVINGRHLVGAQPYSVLEQFMLDNSVPKKDLK